MFKKILFAILYSLFISYYSFAQYQNCYLPSFQRSSAESQRCNCPCIDTIKILYFKSLGDINYIFPAWLPVVDARTVVALEGLVVPNTNGKFDYTHVSGEDFPLNHYTHDFTFDVAPDSTPDNRYTNLLAKRDFHTFVNGIEKIDTIIKDNTIGKEY